MSKCIFGDKNLSIERFRNENHITRLFSVKQVHGNSIILYSPDLPSNSIEADSIIAIKDSICIYVKTADCMPILIETKNYIAAVHAGWRGVVNGITILTCIKLLQLEEKAHQFNISIGPHIFQDSFEVDQDVKEKIILSIDSNDLIITNFLNQLDSQVKLEKNTIFYNSKKKYYIDLKKIVTHQLLRLGIESINDLSIDTVKNLDYHSFRRDGSSAGRNINFIF